MIQFEVTMELVQPIRNIEKIEEIKTVLKETGTRNFLLFIKVLFIKSVLVFFDF